MMRPTLTMGPPASSEAGLNLGRPLSRRRQSGSPLGERQARMGRTAARLETPHRKTPATGDHGLAVARWQTRFEDQHRPGALAPPPDRSLGDRTTDLFVGNRHDHQICQGFEASLPEQTEGANEGGETALHIEGAGGLQPIIEPMRRRPPEAPCPDDRSPARVLRPPDGPHARNRGWGSPSTLGSSSTTTLRPKLSSSRPRRRPQRLIPAASPVAEEMVQSSSSSATEGSGAITGEPNEMLAGSTLTGYRRPWFGQPPPCD